MREMTILNMWAGQFCCEAFNLVIKRLVKQTRPPGRLSSTGVRINLDVTFDPPGSVGNGYGFPSSHSQYMGYFATFLVLHLHFRHKFPSTGYWLIDQTFRTLMYSAVISWTVVVAYSRYGTILRVHRSNTDISGGIIYPIIRPHRYFGGCPLALASDSAITSSQNSFRLGDQTRYSGEHEPSF
jgi:PAP2 superfamily